MGDDDLTPVPEPRRAQRPWHERVMVLVAPVVVIWVLCLTSPGRSLAASDGAEFAALITVVHVPIMWLRVRN